MIQINITNEGDFKFRPSEIEEMIKKTLKENGINSASVDVAIVGRAKMEELNKKYYKDEVYEHPVFTFPANTLDKDFNFPPDSKNHLGQIVINGEATPKTIYELAQHGTLHLVGIHH